MAKNLFPVITDEHWRHCFRRYGKELNSIRQQIKDQINTMNKLKYRIAECEVNEDKIFIPQVQDDDGKWLNVDLCGMFTPASMEEARRHLDRITRVPKPPIYHDYP